MLLRRDLKFEINSEEEMRLINKGFRFQQHYWSIFDYMFSVIRAIICKSGSISFPLPTQKSLSES
jgi:hypothetical protein